MSVLICTRNRPQKLIRCIKSVFALQYDPFEIVVVDNGSENPLIPEMEYPVRTRFFSLPVPGLSYARNFAARQAEGTIVAYLDDDAIPDPNWLEAAAPNFADPHIACVTGRVVPMKSDTEWQAKFARTGWSPDRMTPLRFESANYSPFTSSPGIGCNLFVRRSVLVDHHFSGVMGAGTPVGGAEELYFFYQVIQSGFCIYYDPSAVVQHEFPGTEQEYKTKILRNGIARAAFITRFLVAEPNQRSAALGHIFRRAGGSIEGSDMPFIFKIRGSFFGPIALLRSAMRHKRNAAAAEKGVLLAEFPARSMAPE